MGFLGSSDGKESPFNAEDPGSIPWRREWQSTPIFLPESSLDRVACWATVHGVKKSQTRLRD